MKNIITRLRQFSFSLIIASINPVLSAQPANERPQDNYVFREEIFITTDREIYITGEQVWLKLYMMNGNAGTSSGLSRIIYAELLDASNNTVVQMKIRAQGTSGSGRFLLPDTLASGNYLIRAYSRWMLNYSEALFSYKTISVINPYKNLAGLIRIDVKKPDIPELPSSGIGSSPAGINIGDTGDRRISVSVKSDKPEYLCRSRARLDISVSDATGGHVNADMSVAVVKSPLAGSGRVSFKNASLQDTMITSFRKDSLYLPELEGEIITGVIRDRLTNEPLVNTDISFSVVGKSSICQFGRTNSKGNFMFVLRSVSGMSDIVIQPLSHNASGCYVELNQPFCNTFIDFKPDPLYLDSIKAEEINSAIISMQVNNLYASSEQKQENKQTVTGLHDFYDGPYRRINMADYIELTNIREVVKEILPEVTVTRKNNITGLKVAYSNPYQKFENNALVIVDGIPVYNIEKLLDVPAREIERIDIINIRYFFSDYVFEGIVSFVTKKGNLSDIEFDDSVFRQVFEGCCQPEDFYSPVYSTDSLKKGHIPDFRNTLYWDPDLRTDASGKSTVEFYTSDEPGDYMIIVEGITSDGKTLYGSGLFRVR